MNDPTTFVKLCPAVWVIVPTFNRCNVLLECLSGLSRQTYSNVRIVVVEDGCSDGTVDLVKVNYPEVKILHGTGDSWWSGSMNIGLDYVLRVCEENDFVCSFNDDVLIGLDYINQLVLDCLEVGCDNMMGSTAVDSNLDSKILFQGTRIDWRKGVWKSRPVRTSESIRVVSTDSLPGRGTLFRASMVARIGSYDAVHFPQYFGDEDLSLRARAVGIPLFVSLNAILRSHLAMTGTGRMNQSLFSFLGSLFSKRSPNQLSRRLRFIWRHCPSVYRVSFSFIDVVKVVSAFWRRRDIRKG